MNNIKKTIFFSSCCILATASSIFAASENLDELFARKARFATATWDKSFLENPSTLVWQPETMMYTDVETGHEVWRVSSTKEVKNTFPDIGFAMWSADGKRFSFGSSRDTSACVSGYETTDNYSYQGSVMMMRADGSYLRPADNAPFEVFVHARYLHWSPVEPDVYYGFGRNYAGEGLQTDQLYKVTVGDTSITKQMAFDFNTGFEMNLKKGFSGDGKRLKVGGGGKYFITDIGASVTVPDPDGWAAYRVLDNYWGNTFPDAVYTMHDEFLVGTGSNAKIYFIPEGKASWWRYSLSGSAGDGGPALTIDNTAPYDWNGEIEPVMTGFSSGGTCTNPLYRSPWNCDGDATTGPEQYLSHPGFDRWGHYVAGVNSQQYKGFGVWDLINHKWVDANIPFSSWGYGHVDWEAWSDYFISSPSGSFDITDDIVINKYDGTDMRPVASSHAREAGSVSYNSLPRVTQSPDGTKAVFNSDFLYNTPDKYDIFYAVAYYPHAPEITSVTGSGTYTIRFDWRLGTENPRGYTKRGWPDEAVNNPPPPRETKLFRLWRSPNGSPTVDGKWEPVAEVRADIFSRYNFATGAWIGNDYWEVTDTPGAGTWYYAVTTQEWSGLESRVLSNVFSTSGAQTAAYPSDPKEVKKFYAIAPSWPELSTTQLPTPGQYRLDWKEPDNPVIRYYNIYYSNISTAKAIQNQRIASVPKGTATYVDWLADPAKTGYYLITSVDTQGNESAFASRGGITAKPN